MGRVDPFTRAMFVTLLVALWLGSGAAMAVVTGAIVLWPVAAIDAIQLAAQLADEGASVRVLAQASAPLAGWILAAFGCAGCVQGAWTALEHANVRRCSTLMMVASGLAAWLIHQSGLAFG